MKLPSKQLKFHRQQRIIDTYLLYGEPCRIVQAVPGMTKASLSTATISSHRLPVIDRVVGIHRYTIWL